MYCLSVLPVKEYNYVLNKKQFRDSLQLSYNWPILGLPITCLCGENFHVQHMLPCKKSGFITIRHNEVRDIKAAFSDIFVRSL